MYKKILWLLVWIAPLSHAQERSLRLGNDFGVLHFNSLEEQVNANRYKGGSFSSFNPAVYILKDKNSWFIRFESKRQTLKRANDQFNSIFTIDLTHYMFDIEYYRKIISLSPRASFHLGIGQNGHFNFQELIESQFGFNPSRSVDMAAVNLSINPMFRWDWKKSKLYVRGSLSFFNYGARLNEDTMGDDLKFFAASLDQYLDFQFTASWFLALSKRWDIKPEYRLRYYAFEKNGQVKFLKQSWFLGIYYKI
ncbi:MAG TPA: hypothetical protein DCS93_27000 [Microscillaceae bacterium]|nr:hypothetical protein [Microscillaceae bacterium]